MSTLTFSVRRRDLAWGVALVVLLSAIWAARGDIADAGATPPGQGIAVVYVGVGTNYPDSLGVGPGAGGAAAPIIILPTNPPIPAPSITELQRLDPRSVIIVGGTAVISASMETELGVLLPNATITRIAGANRYETNAMFSAATFPIEGWASIPAIAFTGNTPDVDAVYLGFTYAYNNSDGALFAAIQLPHGAEILELKAEGYDGDVTNNLGVSLYRESQTLNTAVIATVSTSGTPFATTISTTTIAAGTEIVDNENYAYLVYAGGVDGDPYIRNVMVRYRLGASTG